MFRSSTKLMIAAFAVLAIVSPGNAQSPAAFVEAFAGNWQIYDSSFSAGDGKCSLALSKSGGSDRFDVTRANCGGDLADVAKWGVVENQLAFTDAGGLVKVRLGGNQRRMTGTTVSGKPVIFDRVGADGLASQLEAAAKSTGCIYLGFTDKCAPGSELTNPLSNPSSDKRVQVVVNLNARAEARDDAEVIGVVPRDSCVAVETCLTAADGAWCQAKFGERAGWLRKLALRRERWPIVTFVNTCPDAK